MRIFMYIKITNIFMEKIYIYNFNLYLKKINLLKRKHQRRAF